MGTFQRAHTKQKMFTFRVSEKTKTLGSQRGSNGCQVPVSDEEENPDWRQLSTSSTLLSPLQIRITNNCAQVNDGQIMGL